MSTTFDNSRDERHATRRTRTGSPTVASRLPLPVMAVVLAVLAAGSTGFAQDTPDYFRQNCMNCHTIGGGRLTGPDLKHVEQRKDREWLVQFMLNPRAILDSGDPYAAKLLEESRNVPMPVLPGMTRERAEKLLDLIEAESKLEESQFKGLQISNKPFTDGDRQAGRALFQGVQPLLAGGTACLACHTVHGQSALGGGKLGPDLTRVYERLKGRQSLSAWLMAPATETMQPAFKNHPLNADEIHALVAYFEELAPHSEADSSAGRAAFLLLGLGVACACVFALDAAWKRRFRDVRRSLVGRQSHGSRNTTVS